MDNTGQQITKTNKQQFVENVQKWSLIDAKLKLINENTKKLRDMKTELGKNITAYMKENNLEDKKIGLQGGELRLVEKKEYTALTFSYLESCLDNIIADKEQVDFIMNCVREQREVNTVKELRHYSK
jgi:Family of unknown function (DUF5760)